MQTSQPETTSPKVAQENVYLDQLRQKYNQDIIELAVRCRFINQTQKNALSDLISKKGIINVQFLNDTLIKSKLISPENVVFLHKLKMHLDEKSLDMKFGTIAVQNNYVTRQHVDLALREQFEEFKNNKNNVKIGDILVDKGQMASEDRDKVMLKQSRVRSADFETLLKNIGQTEVEQLAKNKLFGEIAVKMNLMSKEKVLKALALQQEQWRAGQKKKWIGDILTEHFNLAPEDKNTIVKEQVRLKINQLNLEMIFDPDHAETEMVHQLDDMLSLSVTPDAMKAYVAVIADLPETITQKNIYLWLRSKKILFGVLNDAIEELLSLNTEREKILIANGALPVSGKLGIEYFFDISRQEDFRGAITVKTLVQAKGTLVKKGTKIAQKMIVSEGSPGKNVHGDYIVHKIRDYPITLGTGIIKNGLGYFAVSYGIPMVILGKDHKVILTVTSTLNIKGNISPSHGHLSFKGISLVVEGDIDKGAFLSCGSLKAHKIAGEVQVSGDVVAEYAITAARVHAQGTVTAERIAESYIEAEKNIVAFESISQSEVMTNGECQVIRKNSKVISSSICAKKGFQLFQVTNDFQNASFYNVLRSGVSIARYKAETGKFQLQKRLAEVTAEITQLKKESLKANQLTTELSQLKSQKEILEESIKSLRQNLRINPNVKKDLQEKKEQLKDVVTHWEALYFEFNQMQVSSIKQKLDAHEAEQKKLTQKLSGYPDHISQQDMEPPVGFIKQSVDQGTIIQGVYSQITMEKVQYNNIRIKEVLSADNQHKIVIH